MLNKYILILLSSFLFMNCDCSCEQDCTNVACTEEFVTIVVTITDQDQNPVILNVYKVINLDTNKDISIDLSDYYQSYPYDGVYPIFDDRYQQDYQNQEVELQFIGFINDQEVINEYYSVGADCCHVYTISDNYDILIE